MEGQISLFEEELDTNSQIVKPPTRQDKTRQDKTVILSWNRR